MKSSLRILRIEGLLRDLPSEEYEVGGCRK
jgi:hypothetical protein